MEKRAYDIVLLTGRKKDNAIGFFVEKYPNMVRHTSKNTLKDIAIGILKTFGIDLNRAQLDGFHETPSHFGTLTFALWVVGIFIMAMINPPEEAVANGAMLSVCLGLLAIAHSVRLPRVFDVGSWLETLEELLVVHLGPDVLVGGLIHKLREDLGARGWATGAVVISRDFRKEATLLRQNFPDKRLVVVDIRHSGDPWEGLRALETAEFTRAGIEVYDFYDRGNTTDLYAQLANLMYSPPA